MNTNAANRVRSLFDDLTRDRKTVLKILSVILILMTAVLFRLHGESTADVSVDTDQSASSAVNICVDIGGGVLRPGVYNVSADTRLYEVIEMAGGLTSDADTDSINQAAVVEDGQKILIPVHRKDDSDEDELFDSPGYSDTESGLVNINTATAEELKTLQGIGDVMAGRIIEYRSSNRFRNIEEIKSVKGIGESTYNNIKDDITV